MKLKVDNKIFKNKHFQMSRKISLVVFITLLIWVWADLSLDEEHRESGALLTISRSADPALWVRFKDSDGTQMPLNQIKLAGPVLRIAELKKDLDSGAYKLSFTLDPDREVIRESSVAYSLPVLGLLQKNKDLRKRGLKVIECTPEKIELLATKLVPKTLKVVCYNEAMVIANAVIVPAEIKVLVPPKLNGNALEAYVKLTSQNIAKARTGEIELMPSVDFAIGVSRQTSQTVKIKLPESGINIETFSLQGRIGLIMSPELAAKYKVKIQNKGDFTTAIPVQATDQARKVYEAQMYHYLLEIKAEDAKLEQASRVPVYNFPQEFVNKNEIRAAKKLEPARFKLIQINQTNP